MPRPLQQEGGAEGHKTPKRGPLVGRTGQLPLLKFRTASPCGTKTGRVLGRDLRRPSFGMETPTFCGGMRLPPFFSYQICCRTTIQYDVWGEEKVCIGVAG